ncbi:drebrin-like protein isoform X3 [Gadus chalcogrammus]|uniref:drebrin-like protein isoform X3 n=1 Tax=Gadus chalcogrammus TaxID=1042646 RepID=UPI0024C3D71D|nr:drebrin-like protein isoform X3 [Gadus chalcogrammus]
MAANLSKNGVTLLAAYKDVVDGRSHTNWAVFTYEGDSSIVRLAGKGEGGLEEMVEELSSGKVMYAFCCVKDPNSGLPKYVLINWTGEGVKDCRKGVYANHVTSLANFLKGAHVTVNARAEEDVEPATVLDKVAKASGVNFNFHMKTAEHSHEPSGPVGSVYKKTNAKDEIQSTAKERFWGQTQRDEKVPPKVDGKRVEEETWRVEREKREREERQVREREKREKEKSPSIIWNRSFQKIIEAEKGNMVKQNTQVSVYKKINARDEIQKTNKDHFWAQTQKEEEERRKETSKRVEEEKQRVEREKRALEERQAKGRGKGGNEKKASIIQNRSFQMILQIETREKEQHKMVHQVPSYKKINARDEIQKTDKDHFWAQTQAEEEHRKESRKRVEEEKQRIEREKRELEEGQAKEREKRDKENRALIVQNSFQKKQEMERIDKTQQKIHTKYEELRPNKTYQNNGIQTAESVQKANEAKLLISQRSFNPRDVFKQQNQQSPVVNNGAPLTPQPGKLRSPFLSQDSSDGGAAGPEPKRRPSPSPAPVVRKAPSSSSSSTISAGRGEIAASPVRSDPPMESPSSALYENDLPPGQPTDNASSEDEWSDEFEDDDDYDVLEGAYKKEEPLYEDLYEEVPNLTVEDQTLKAKALYNYQAVDDTEISFNPHDLITGIGKVDRGWWRGYAPNGHYGLFPANYVELLL